jgi:cytochrome P450
MSSASALVDPNAPARFRPAVPKPLREQPGLFGFLRAARANPLTTWLDVHFEKPVVAADGALGRVTVVSDPSLIRYLYVENAANYRKDDLQRRVLAPGLGNGLLTAEGDEWKLQRRTLAPIFSARHVPQGRASDPDALGRAITRFLESVGPIDPLDVFGVPGFVPRIGRLRARPALRFFAEVVDELIARRRSLIAKDAAPADLLTLLLKAQDPETGQGLTDLEVKANIVTFIAAGHETTANALTWALYCLSQDSDARTRVEAEVDAVEPGADFDADALPFTKAVMEETMRLFPPVPFMSRQAIAEDRIGRIKIPKGSLVMVAPWVLHRHRTLWQEPDAFMPERFLPENRAAIPRFAYLPFGAGPRVCIGQSFSLQEAVVVLAHVTRAARFTLADDHAPVMPLHRVTLRPENGLRMTVSPRG